MLDYYKKGDNNNNSIKNEHNIYLEEMQKAESSETTHRVRMVITKTYNEDIEEKDYIIDTMISITQLVREWIKQGKVEAVIDDQWSKWLDNETKDNQ